MTAPIPDPIRDEPPALDRHLPPLEHRLPPRDRAAAADAASPGDDVVLLAGRRVLVGIDTGSGVPEIRGLPIIALRGPRIEGALPVRCEASPLGIDRRLRLAAGDDGPATHLAERIFAAWALPAAIVQWQADAAVTLPVRWRIRLFDAGTARADARHAPTTARTDLAWQADGRMLRVAPADGSGDVACFVFSHAPDAWRVVPISDGPDHGLEVAAMIRIGAGESARLGIVTGTDRDDLESALAALRDAPALVLAREAALHRMSAEGITVRAPDADLGETIEWAKYWLAAGLGADAPGTDRVRPDVRAATAFVTEVLGFEPDAPRDRVRLAPRIPAAWSWLDVDRLQVGDAQIGMRYRRDGSTHVYRVEQTAGAVPLTLIFEPELPATTLAAARVDGRPAELDAVATGDRLRVPVQLVLDHERTVELETR